MQVNETKMRLLKVGLLIVLASFILVELCEGARGGRSGGRSSRSGRKSSAGSRSSGGASKPKITKTTPIKATTRKTAVINRQTKIGSRSNTFRNVLLGYVVYRYAFSSAPVYRQGYPMHGRYVQIPEKRAVRVMSTETRMLDHDRKPCIEKEHEGVERTLPSDAQKNVVGVNMTITYGSEKPIEFNGINQNFTLREKEGVDFVIVSRTQYNITLVAGRNCTVVEERMEGTVVHLYETNPDGASTTVLNTWLLLFTTVIAFLWAKNPEHS